MATVNQESWIDFRQAAGGRHSVHGRHSSIAEPTFCSIFPHIGFGIHTGPWRHAAQNRVMIGSLIDLKNSIH
jgi:hypothetical protein